MPAGCSWNLALEPDQRAEDRRRDQPDDDAEFGRKVEVHVGGRRGEGGPAGAVGPAGPAGARRRPWPTSRR